MNDLVDMTTTAASPAARVVLHWSFSDPRSPLRIAVPPPPALRVALIAQLGAHGGTVVDHAEGLFSFHRKTAQAVRAAIEILTTGTSMLVDEIAPVSLRATLVGSDDGSDLGRAAAVNRAVQISRLSRDHTLLLSRDLHAELEPALAERCRLAAAPAAIEHFAELADLFDLDWRLAASLKPPLTTSASESPAIGAPDALELVHGGMQLSLTAEDCPVTLGRDKSCRVHLGGDAASRVHGRIEYLHDKFYFVDDSRNGTYLLTPQGEEVFLRGERLPLLGRGVISPGAPIVKQTGEVVRYTCRSQAGPNEWMTALALPPDAAETKFTH